jgi:hypothetical protein
MTTLIMFLMCCPKWENNGPNPQSPKANAMPTFRTSLPPEGQHQGFELRRTPECTATQGVITCDDLIVCDTHYWHARTLPCERTISPEGKTLDDSACQACQEKAAWRTHVYVSVFDAKRHEHFLFECTAMAAKPLEEYRHANGTLRGCILYASRPKGRKNAKVAIQTNTANLAKFSLPQPPDITAALAVIWRLPRKAIDETHQPDKPITLRTKADRLTAMRQQADNAKDPPTMAEILAGNGHH